MPNPVGFDRSDLDRIYYIQWQMQDFAQGGEKSGHEVPRKNKAFSGRFDKKREFVPHPSA